MRKLFRTVACVMAIATLVSCSEDWDGMTSSVKVSTTVTTQVNLDELNGTTIEFTDVNTQEVTVGKFKADGTCQVNIVPGVYNITVESEIKGTGEDAVRYCAAQENVTIKNENVTLDLNIKAFPAVINNDGFIVSEYFFNGETNMGRMMHPDQYIVFHNNSLLTQYADGLTFGTTDQASISNKEPYFDGKIDMEEKVALTGMFTVPGDGKTYPVAPGDKFVVAYTAINHNEVKTWYPVYNEDYTQVVDSILVSYDNAVDLSGADLEIYQPEFTSDTDNPEVPNAIVTDGTWGGGYTQVGGYMHPRGFYSLVVFKLQDGKQETVRNYFEENTSAYKYPNTTDKDGNSVEGAEIVLLTVDTKNVIDAICTGDRALVTRPFSESLDRGYFQVSGCHRQENCVRKTVDVDGVKYYQDTNNSTADFDMIKGQTAFPKGWRELSKTSGLQRAAYRPYEGPINNQDCIAVERPSRTK